MNINKLLSDSTGKLNVLMASISSPVSSPIYYERALRKKHNVITFGPYRDKAFWEGFASGLKSHFYYREGAMEHWVDICSRLSKPCNIVSPRGTLDIREVLKVLPQGFVPDIFLWIDQHGENIPLNLKFLDCPKIALFGDTHLGDMKWRLDYALNYDYVFVTFNKQHKENFEQAGSKKVFWSPAACDPELYCKIPAEKIYPVSFVGSTHPYLHYERVKLLEFLKNNQIDLYIDSKLLQDMSLISSRSKIVLNRSIGDDLNQRVFESMGAGSFFLTNRITEKSGMEELFVNKEHLVLYNNPNELLELIKYYLEHEQERERIALNGYNEILKKHTFDVRISEIFGIVKKDLASNN